MSEHRPPWLRHVRLRRFVVWSRWLMKPSRRRVSKIRLSQREVARAVEVARESILAQSY